jgi:hypothetical protein
MRTPRGIAIVLLILVGVAAAQAPVTVHDGFFTGRQFLDLPQDVRFFYAPGLVDGIFLAPLLGAPEQNLDRFAACLEPMTNQQVATLLSSYLDSHPEWWRRGANTAMYQALNEKCATAPQ